MHLANDINQAFLCPQQAFSPIPDDYHVSTSGYETPNISLEQCFKWLNAVVASKTGGPDDIPNWVLREFALELAQPVCSVLNTSFITGSMPEI